MRTLYDLLEGDFEFYVNLMQQLVFEAATIQSKRGIMIVDSHKGESVYNFFYRAELALKLGAQVYMASTRHVHEDGDGAPVFTKEAIVFGAAHAQSFDFDEVISLVKSVHPNVGVEVVARDGDYQVAIFWCEEEEARNSVWRTIWDYWVAK